MSRTWNGKALLDHLGKRVWNTTTAYRSTIIEWINEIQDDIVTEIPMDYFLFKTKKLLPTDIELISLNPEIAGAPTAAIASGGSLTEDSKYKVGITFVIYDPNTNKYIESEMVNYSSVVTATAANKTIDLTAIPVMGGASDQPSTIYRNIYVSVSTDAGVTYGEPFYSAQIADNTTTTASITAEATSTVTPPSGSELDQLSSKQMVFSGSARYLEKISQSKIQRFDSNGSESTGPDFFDYLGTDSIFLYPKLSSSATTAQRTLIYWIYRRPHEVFDDVDRMIDLPIQFKKALVQGVVWKSYEYNDRDGKISEFNKYEAMKKEIINRITRQKGKPTPVRDVNGGIFGEEI